MRYDVFIMEDELMDTEFFKRALHEHNMRSPAHMKFKSFGELTPAEQSFVMLRAQELKEASNG